MAGGGLIMWPWGNAGRWEALLMVILTNVASFYGGKTSNASSYQILARIARLGGEWPQLAVREECMQALAGLTARLAWRLLEPKASRMGDATRATR